MLAKLALRNVRRSAKDYLVYFFTMTVVVALMFAFNSLLFSKEIRDSFQGVEIMEGGSMIMPILIRVEDTITSISIKGI